MVGGVEFVGEIGDRLKEVVSYIQFLLLACVVWVELLGVEWAVVGGVEFDLVVGDRLKRWLVIFNFSYLHVFYGLSCLVLNGKWLVVLNLIWWLVIC